MARSFHAWDRRAGDKREPGRREPELGRRGPEPDGREVGAVHRGRVRGSRRRGRVRGSGRRVPRGRLAPVGRRPEGPECSHSPGHPPHRAPGPGSTTPGNDQICYAKAYITDTCRYNLKKKKTVK